MTAPKLTKEEFCARFKARMYRDAPFTRFENAIAIMDHVNEVADLYYEDHKINGKTPEQLALLEIRILNRYDH